MSYLKQLPCETCYTYSIYYFPKKPTEKYCYCSFRDEIGEQIAREIEELPYYGSVKDAVENAAKIARGEK